MEKYLFPIEKHLIYEKTASDEYDKDFAASKSYQCSICDSYGITKIVEPNESHRHELKKIPSRKKGFSKYG